MGPQVKGRVVKKITNLGGLFAMRSPFQTSYSRLHQTWVSPLSPPNLHFYGVGQRLGVSSSLRTLHILLCLFLAAPQLSASPHWLLGRNHSLGEGSTAGESETGPGREGVMACRMSHGSLKGLGLKTSASLSPWLWAALGGGMALVRGLSTLGATLRD